MTFDKFFEINHGKSLKSYLREGFGESKILIEIMSAYMNWLNERVNDLEAAKEKSK